MNSCCLNCTDRTVGCHATCERYMEYKRDLDKIRTKQKRNSEYGQYFTSVGLRMGRQIKTI